MPDQPFLTTSETAELFGVTVSAISRWVKEGRLPASGRYGIGARAPLLFDPAALTEWGTELRRLDNGR